MKFSRSTHRQAREEKQRKLKYIRRRARELLPLCEEATGVELKVPLVVNATNLPKLLLDVQRRVLKTFILRHVEERGFLDMFEYLGFLSASVHLNVKAFVVLDAFGYYDHLTKSVGINLSKFDPNAVDSDYVLAHELVHLLLAQLGLDKPINSHIVLIEGAATYYGERVVQTFDPSFDVTTLDTFGGVYERGYTFFERLEDEGFDSIVTINSRSPLVSRSYKCENCGRTHTTHDLIDAAEYIRMLKFYSLIRSVIGDPDP